MATRRRTRARRAPCGPRAAAPRARQAGRETRGSAAGLVGASSAVLRRCWRTLRTTLSASVLYESLATRAAVVLSACRLLHLSKVSKTLKGKLHAIPARSRPVCQTRAQRCAEEWSARRTKRQHGLSGPRFEGCNERESTIRAPEGCPRQADISRTRPRQHSATGARRGCRRGAAPGPGLPPARESANVS